MRILKSIAMAFVLGFTAQVYASDGACLVFPIGQLEDGSWLYYGEYFLETAPNFTCQYDNIAYAVCENQYTSGTGFCSSTVSACGSFELPSDCYWLTF